MEFKVLQMLVTLLSGMTSTEIATFLFTIAGLIVISVKVTLKVSEYLNKHNKKSSEFDDSEDEEPSNSKNKFQRSQMLIHLNVLKDNVAAIDSKIEKMDGHLINDIKSLLVSLEKLHLEQLEYKKELITNIEAIEENVQNVKDKLAQLEIQIPNMSSSHKDLLKDLNLGVQGVSKDIATLTGTIIGNLSSRNSR